jgi:RNA polymerase sigma factor (sigma-70 family)
MADAAKDPILRSIRALGGRAGAQGVADRELLSRFVLEHDEAAFELLLWRYASLVRHVCQTVTRDHHDAEDAFQATFLVLARKAWSVHKCDSLAAWLYRVAYHIALRARRQTVQRARHEKHGLDLHALPENDPAGEAAQELRPLLFEEVNRLPGKYRTPILLCYLQGKTLEEAARFLGWPKGTVSGRLARAREMLRGRLIRRGITSSDGALIAALAPGNASAVAPMMRTILQTALRFAEGKAGVAAPIAEPSARLAKGMLRAMFMTKLKLCAGVVCAAVLLGSGAGLCAEYVFGARQATPEIAPPDGLPMEEAVAPARKPGTDEEAKARPLTPEERFKALVKEFDSGSQHVSRRDGYEKQILKLAQENAREPFAVDALLWILKRGWQANGGILLATSQPFGESAGKALELLARDHAQDKRVGEILEWLSLAPPAADRFLLAVMKKNPDRRLQALACLSLASRCKYQAELAHFNSTLTRVADTAKEQEQFARLAAKYKEDETRWWESAGKYFAMTITKFGDVPYHDHGTMGEYATGLLLEGGSRVMPWTRLNLASIVLVFVRMAMVAGEQTDRDATVKQELKKLEGTWEVVSVESDGRQGAAEDLKGLAYVFETNGKWKLQKDGEAQAEGTFTVDPAQKPRRIDYKIESSISEESKGKSSLGIYELDGDTLKVCRTWPDHDQRPTEFAAGAGSKCILTELKRKRK